MIKNIVAITHQIMKTTVAAGDAVLDATVGKGNDTVFMAQLVGQTGRVYGCDIQAKALELATKRLATEGLLDRTTLFHSGHEHIGALLPDAVKLKLAVFNLGYLPTGDKAIITQPQTTIAAIQQVLPRLPAGGVILIAAYIGHEGGHAEYSGVLDYLSHLPQNQYHIGKFEFINQENMPPKLLILERS